MTALPRVGVGVDVHAYAPEGSDRQLWVAGLHWPGERGLDGHSDADVAAHAACDALFSAAGIGDLGAHFGTSRPELAGAPGVTRVEDGDPEEWEQMYATNVVGTLRVTQAALPLLRRSARATIVDISSIAGERVYEGGAGYVAAKHGTSVVSETLRLELNGENIRVVDIRPGMVRTEEFSLTRLHGDRAAADKVYDGVDRPLAAADVAECVGFVVGLPQHVNIDTMVIKPVAQAAPHKVHRGPIDWTQDR
jgi:2-C-methyl-D-erythritol 2,4-cyclodiphosphate synthase